MPGLQMALKFTLDYEGGWVNNVNDKGGETFRGISRNHWPEWKGWVIIDEEKKKSRFPMCLMDSEPLIESMLEFYVSNFWDKIHGDELPVRMAIAVFDFAVNSGVGTAIRTMQSVLGVSTDGVIGPKTVKAAHDSGENGVIELLARRAKFLHEIMDRDPSQKVWCMNWFRRLFKLADLVLEG
jgi:lysozyme family protein